MILFITILIGACLALSPYIVTKFENRKKPIMFFIVNNRDRTDPKIVDNADTWADAVYQARILSRMMPHTELTIEKV